MALDTKSPNRWPQIKARYRTTAQLLEASERDPDPVTVLVDGTSWEDASGAIFVVKDGPTALKLSERLRDAGATTLNPIPAPARNPLATWEPPAQPIKMTLNVGGSKVEIMYDTKQVKEYGSVLAACNAAYVMCMQFQATAFKKREETQPGTPS